jgi:hypothetical protein
MTLIGLVDHDAFLCVNCAHLIYTFEKMNVYDWLPRDVMSCVSCATPSVGNTSPRYTSRTEAKVVQWK